MTNVLVNPAMIVPNVIAWRNVRRALVKTTPVAFPVEAVTHQHFSFSDHEYVGQDAAGHEKYKEKQCSINFLV